IAITLWVREYCLPVEQLHEFLGRLLGIAEDHASHDLLVLIEQVSPNRRYASLVRAEDDVAGVYFLLHSLVGWPYPAATRNLARLAGYRMWHVISRTAAP